VPEAVLETPKVEGIKIGIVPKMANPKNMHIKMGANILVWSDILGRII
jgi:hypothetical protein